MRVLDRMRWLQLHWAATITGHADGGSERLRFPGSTGGRLEPVWRSAQLCGADHCQSPNSHSQLAFALIAPIQITYAFTRSPFFNSFRSSSMSVFCTTIQCSSEPSLKRNSVVN